jgi:exopolysaccharide biosynthesis polyprenyl glycosylphosphotransferase
MHATGGTVATDRHITQAHPTPQTIPAWTNSYVSRQAVGDWICALIAGALAIRLRFAGHEYLPLPYVIFTCTLPALWGISLVLTGGYDPRFIGLGSEEFRRVLNAALSLAAALAIVSYAAKLDFARGYMLVALPVTVMLDLTTRFLLRKNLHRRRGRGACIRRVIAVGHGAAVSELVTTLRRESSHGLAVVAACVADACGPSEIKGIPVAGDLDDVAAAVGRFGADTVAVLTCPEIDGTRLRELAWELEKTRTDLCVAPALLDVAGPRTTIRPVAGLPLLHVDHAELSGGKQIIKGIIDRVLASLVLVALAPLLLAITLAIRCTDSGPALFRQTRVGRGGRTFTLYKFRTMVVEAEQLKALLATSNEADGALFKIRRDPRITRTGAILRRWSLDELPQLLNVIRGNMSLVGPRPALPNETERYGTHMRRRLAVKPGITGLWQVNGRSDLSWDEAVRLDVRYVENWSFGLDLHILLKTGTAVLHGSGAY